MLNLNMGSEYPKECPCCREGTISDFHDVCMICGWEDDEVQNSNPLYAGGANKQSLEQHRATFSELRKKNKSYMWCNTWK